MNLESKISMEPIRRNLGIGNERVIRISMNSLNITLLNVSLMKVKRVKRAVTISIAI